jgi:serine/threonine protein kinase
MIGKTISHYKTLEELGEGGMGMVYKAQDTKSSRLVAIKSLPQNLTAVSVAEERSTDETIPVWNSPVASTSTGFRLVILCRRERWC